MPARFPSRALGPLVAGLVADAAGQAAGFFPLRATTGGASVDLDLELERLRHVPAGEAATLR
jgi:hypothetical protein